MRRVSKASGRIGALLESLEPRQHFAADLSVYWDPSYPPSPTTIAPGEGLLQELDVVNLSGQAQIAGNGRFEYYLSTDRTLDEQDIRIPAPTRVYMALTGHQPYPVAGDLQIPSDIVPGSYYLIAKVTPEASFADPDLSNNIAVTAAPINIQRRYADLSAYWDTAHFQLPSILVPGERLNTPLKVTNLTGQPEILGNARFDYYFSTDSTLDDLDIPIRSIASQFVDFAGHAPQTYNDNLSIPTDIAPGSYYLIAKVTPVAHFDDPDLSSNVAVTGSPISILRRFGDFAGRTDVMAVIRGPDGHDVNFTQDNGGYGEVTVGPTGLGVTITDANESSAVFAIPSDYANASPTPFDLASITINGTLGFFEASHARLRGPLVVGTSLSSLSLGDVLGPLSISIPVSSRAPNLSFGNVSEISIDSAAGISSIYAKNWLDLDGRPDSIRAPWLGALTIRAGNFYPSLYLAGPSSPPGQGFTLGPVQISGVVKAGSWSVSGNASSVHVYASTVNWSASFLGSVGSLTTDASFRGVFTGHSIASITSGRDLLYGRILAGAFLGSDGRFGGSGADADTYTTGSIGLISVFHNVAGCWIGAGWNPVDGIFDNGNDRIEGAFGGSIGRITIGHIAGAQSRFIANYYGTSFPDPGDTITIGGVHVDWRHDRRFALGTV
jgi:hypothetical protein